MTLWTMLAILLTMTAVFSYINSRFMGLPSTIGVMFSALMFSVLILVLRTMGISAFRPWQILLHGINFNAIVLHGFLAFLLFSGALTINLQELSRQKWLIGMLATVGIMLSTFIIGYGSYYLFGMLGLQIHVIYCLLFGALISPTDPIAVLALMKRLRIPQHLHMQIAGESLFNDGIGVVLFLALLSQATHHTLNLTHVVTLFFRQALGGIMLGFLLGAIAFYLLRTVDEYVTEILITLALVSGGYSLGDWLGVSGPLAMVVAGLLIGTFARAQAMSEQTQSILDTFWHVVDELLNALLFVLMGLELLITPLHAFYVWSMLLAIPLVIGARWLSIALPYLVLRFRMRFVRYTIAVLTWGGLRGGLAIAMALSLPSNPQRDVIIAITYAVVVFSVLVQGITVSKLLERVA